MLLIPPLIKKEETFFNFSNLINVCLSSNRSFQPFNNTEITFSDTQQKLCKFPSCSPWKDRTKDRKRERGARRINEENDESRCNREIDGRAAPVSVSLPMKNENVRIHNNGIHKAAITKTYTAPLCVFYGGE